MHDRAQLALKYVYTYIIYNIWIISIVFNRFGLEFLLIQSVNNACVYGYVRYIHIFSVFGTCIGGTFDTRAYAHISYRYVLDCCRIVNATANDGRRPERQF